MLQRSLRIISLAVIAAGLTACGGSGIGGILGGGGGGNQCNIGTQVQLANPTPFQTNVNPNIGSITFVANGNNNNLYNTYTQYNITVQDNFGNTYQGGQLQLVPDPSGPHPYPSDYYYQSTIGNLQPGLTYTVTLTQFGACTYPLGQFST